MAKFHYKPVRPDEQLRIDPVMLTSVRDGEKWIGVTLKDLHNSHIIDTWPDIPINDLEVLERVVTNKHPDVIDMLNKVRTGMEAITIGIQEYEWDKIKEVIGEHVVRIDTENDEEETGSGTAGRGLAESLASKPAA